MKLSEMKQILSAGDIQLTKALGQNFLHDGNQLRRIVDAAELSATDRVLEIGPGLGPLTELLLQESGEVLAIEKDARLVTFLQQRFAEPIQSARLRLYHDDALDYLRRNGHRWADWKLVANLPYSVASPILVDLAQAQPGPARLVATLQIEVAKRLMAGPDNPDYGVLTLLVQLHYEARGWFKIPAGCFFPAPEVDSACISMVRRPAPLLAPEQVASFNKIVKRAFSQRRKMMLKLLKADWPLEKLERIFGELKISLLERAEKIGLEQFVALTKALYERRDL